MARRLVYRPGGFGFDEPIYFFGDDMDNRTCMTCVHLQKVNKLRPNVQGYKIVSACVKYPDHYIFSDHMTSPGTHFCSEYKMMETSSSNVLNPRTLLLRGEDLVNPQDKDPKISSFRVPMGEIELADLVFFQQEIGDALVCLKNRFTSFSIQ